MATWGYGWNENDSVNNQILDICEFHKAKALINGKKVISGVSFNSIDSYRVKFMIYMNIANSLGAVASFTNDDVEIFAKASLTAHEFLEEILDGVEEGKIKSPWDDFSTYRATVRSELECFNEWLKSGA